MAASMRGEMRGNLSGEVRRDLTRLAQSGIHHVDNRACFMLIGLNMRRPFCTGHLAFLGLLRLWWLTTDKLIYFRFS